MSYLFTSESVSQGHPDKVSDKISDSVLDAMLEQDPMSRVACETLCTTGLVVVAGEITSKAIVDIPAIVRKAIREVGYNDPTIGFDADSCGVLVTLDKQSPDISQGVSAGQGLHKEQGAGDQGMMYGYACNETRVFMPLAIHLAHRINEALAAAREKKQIKWLRPDSKSQVTVEYKGLKPVRVHTVVVSTQHSPDVAYATIRKTVIDKIIKKVISAKMLDKNTIYHVNPTGRFVVGGPHGDTGLTGRKIIVDSYGGYGGHGGGAFSGKDPTKVDRSAAYAVRHAAKNVVAAGLATHCQIQISYAIGVAKPISLNVNTFGTGVLPDVKIAAIVEKLFDMRPAAIIARLKLRRPIFRLTTNYGHFGRELPEFTWEKLDMVAALKKAAKLK
jgi:S-adenosylmethionine synthetase